MNDPEDLLGCLFVAIVACPAIIIRDPHAAVSRGSLDPSDNAMAKDSPH